MATTSEMPRAAEAPAGGETKPNGQKALARKNPLQALLEKNLAAIEAALPRHITAERMIRLAVTAWNTTPDLQKCEVRSLLAAIVKMSQFGLEIGAGGAWLVPFKNTALSKRTGHDVWEAQVITDYRGLIKLARNTGEVGDVKADVVYACDRFELVDDETGTHMRHVRCTDPDCDGHVKARILGAWARAMFRPLDGNMQPSSIVFMTRAEIERVRAVSKMKDGGMWITDYGEACKKTVIRRASKFWPQSPHMRELLEMENRADAGESQTIEIPSIDLTDSERVAAATATAEEGLEQRVAEARRRAEQEAGALAEAAAVKRNLEQQQAARGPQSGPTAAADSEVLNQAAAPTAAPTVKCPNPKCGAVPSPEVKFRTKSQSGGIRYECGNCGHVFVVAAPPAAPEQEDPGANG